MIELGITGAKNAGKTTLIIELIEQLTATGATVATVKHSGHRHTFDTEGKDSYRHRQVGAQLTVAVSESEVALFAHPESGVYDNLMEFIRKRFDWCLIEGDKRSKRPKVYLTNRREMLKGELPENIIATYGDELYSEDVPHFSRGDVSGLVECLTATMTVHDGSVVSSE